MYSKIGGANYNYFGRLFLAIWPCISLGWQDHGFRDGCKADAMKSPIEAMALPAVFHRWRSLNNRDLWLLLVGLVALDLLLISLLTQPAEDVLNVLLVFCGAVLVLHAPPGGWQPQPGRIGRWVGVALLVAALWRGQRMMSFDFISSLLPLLAGISLALLAAPVSQLRSFLPSLSLLALLPVIRAVGWLTPLGPLSVATAWLTQQMLTLGGVTSEQVGTSVKLQSAGVIVAGPCAGLSILLQLLLVAVIFAMAFPMRHRWQNGLMLLGAPLIGMVVNGMRITLLALLISSNLANKQWWFDFFHDHWGSLLFSGLGMQLFVWLYVYWMARQVAAMGAR
jgi:exosortase/archaeosortase family protein